MAPFRWRRWNTILHRDIGYLVTGLTLVYGVSGIAVNHAADWNPSYSITHEERSIEPVGASDREAIIAEVKQKLGLTGEERSSFRPDPETLRLFFEDQTVSVDLPTGTVLIERVRRRPVLFEVNQLHLNTPKGWWTLIADAYALGLIIVAVTGLFVLKGKTGITGRGAWLTGIGLLIPVAYWLAYRTLE